MTPTADDPDFEALLEFLRASRGFDFTAYKRTSLGRRFAKRLQAVGADGYAEYLDYLQVHPDKYTALFDTILINVTSFLRDAPAWAHLDEQVLPQLLAGKRPDEDIRVWSAGCASGEEPYSIAMLLVRALGEEAFRQRVKIYATDVDDAALETARHGVYPREALEEVPVDLVDLCFEPANGRLAFRSALRRSVIFGRNDLVQDASILRLDLLFCRNVLMYFTAETQAQVIGRLHFALDDDGRLFLRKSEMLLTHSELFRPVNLKCRIFEKVPQPALRARLGRLAPGGEPAPPIPGAFAPVRDATFDAAPIAQLAVDRAGTLALANQRARSLLGIEVEDVGRPVQDLEVSYRPVELRAAIERAQAQRAAVALGEVRWAAPGQDERRYDVSVAPLLSPEDALVGASVTFTDVAAHAALRDELERAKRELEVAYEELQSTVEELETTNEELQSTNEELETMNEELQSTNEELETINDELRGRTSELDRANAYLEGILRSLEVGVAVVDAGHVVQLWNARAEDLWGLRPDEAAGQHLLSLDIGLPVDRLRAPVREALSGARPQPVLLEATNRRGRSIAVRVSTVPLSGDGDAGGAIVVMQEQPARAE